MMKLDIRPRNLDLTDRLRERIERRMHFALSRFEPRIERVTIRLFDVNGPRGGEDKRCRIVVRVRGCEPAAVVEADRDLGTAIDRAADRVGRVVARALDRLTRPRRATA